MRKRVRLSESDLNRIIKGQVKKTINEISYGTVDDAKSINHNLFWGLQNGSREIEYVDGFDNFYRKLEDLESALEEFTTNLPKDSANPNIIKINSLVSKLYSNLAAVRTCSDEINNIFIRKEKQRDNFDDAIRNYDDAHYSEDDDLSWDDYRKGEINNI